MKRWLLILTALLMLHAGVQLRARDIKGSVFIVTQGGQAIKLALAKVYVLTPAGIEQMKAQRQQREQQVAATIAQHYQAMLDDIQRIEAATFPQAAAMLTAKQALDKFNAEVRAPLLQQWGDGPKLPPYGDIQTRARITREWEQQTRYSEWRSLHGSFMLAAGALNREKDLIESAANNLKAEHDLFAIKAQQELDSPMEPPAGLPPAARCDVDGGFAIMASQEAWIYINASRQMPREYYSWLLPVSELIPDGAAVLFSNHNLYQR